MSAENPSLTGPESAAALAAVAEIARRHLRLDTLETRHSDTADFREIAVWSIRDALIAAYNAGASAAAAGRED